MKKRTTFGIGAILIAAGLAFAPAGIANASYTHYFGSGSCTTATAFIKSNSTGYTIHSRNNVTLSIWSIGAFYETKQTQMQPTWNTAHVSGQDGGTNPPAVLGWAVTGCGGL